MLQHFDIVFSYVPLPSHHPIFAVVVVVANWTNGYKAKSCDRLRRVYVSDKTMHIISLCSSKISTYTVASRIDQGLGTTAKGDGDSSGSY